MPMAVTTRETTTLRRTVQFATMSTATSVLAAGASILAGLLLALAFGTAVDSLMLSINGIGVHK